MALQHLRTSTAHKRPIPSVMSAGQLAVNTNEASPGLFFKDSNGDLVKVGPVHIGTDAPNSSPASVAATALVTGTVYQILTVGTSDFTLVGASANTVGTIFTATGTTTGDGTVSGQQGVEKGEQWLDTTGGTYVLKIYDGTAWRSESGTFVDVNGDTMTGSLILPSGTAAAPALGVGSTDNGLYSPGTDQVAVSTNGTGRLFIDSSGNVGVGTSSPENYGSGYVTVEARGASGDAGGIFQTRTYDASVKSYFYCDSGTDTARIGTVTNHPFLFVTGTTERMRIDSSGNVGIGTTSPGAKLHVNSGTANTCATFESTDAGAAINLTDSNARSTIEQNGTTLSIIADTDASDASSDIRLKVDDSTKLIVDSSGNVGIGTSAPAVLLDLESTSPIIRLTDSDATGTPECQISGAGGDLILEADRDNEKSDSLIRMQVDGSERLRIDSSGNVGIGTTNPSAKLEVETANSERIIFDSAGSNQQPRIQLVRDSGATYSFTNASGPLEIKKDSDNIYRYSSNNHLFFTAGVSERLRIDSSGNVGIGTTNPGYKLEITESSANSLVRFDGANSAQLVFRNATSNVFELNAAGGNDELSFGTAGNNERMRIDDSGRVGIGTSSPSYALQINATNPRIRLEETSSGGNKRIEMWVDPSDSVGYIGANQSAQQLSFQTSNTDRIRITNAGDIGIGTTSPAAKLHVENGDVRLEKDTKVTIGFRGHTTGSTDLAFRDANAGVDRMTLDSSGNVGIGTTSASSILTAGTGTGTNAITINGSGSSTSVNQLIFYGGGTNNPSAAIEYDGADKGIAFQIGNYSTLSSSEAMRIDSSGNTGIGTSSPSAKGHISNSYSAPTGGHDSNLALIVSNSGSANNYTGIGIASGNNGGSFIHFGDTDDDNVGALNYFHDTNSLTLVTAANERMRIDSSGRLLVGTSSTSVTSTLVLQGNSVSSSSQANLNISCGTTTPTNGQALGLVAFGDGNQATGSQITARADAAGWTSGSSRPSRLEFSTCASGSSSLTERMRIDSSGKVGIGETNMDALLVIKGNSDAATTPSIRLKDGTDTREAWITNSAGDLSLNVGGDDNVAHGTFKMFESGILDYAQGASSRLRIDASGNVGIGQTSPSAKLDVNGNVQFGDGGGFDMNINGTRHQFSIGGSEKMRIDSSGNVGIGVSSVIGKLHANDSSGAVLTLTRTSGATSGDLGKIRFGNTNIDSALASVTAIQDGATNNSALTFGTQSTGAAEVERLRIDSSGRVGIGTTQAAGSNPLTVLTTSGNGLVFTKGVTGGYWDNEYVSIKIQNNSSDGNNRAEIRFGVPADGTSDLKFFTQSSSNNVSERMRIHSGGKLTVPGVYSGTTTGGSAVYVESDGDLLRYTSSLKYKTDVETIEDARADAILSCRPVWYRSKCANDVKTEGAEKSDWGWYGFIAEEVAEVEPRLVNWATKDAVEQEDGSVQSVERDPADYEAEGVRYDNFVPLLVNLVKRQQQAIETLEQRLTDAGL